jgi:hypothetical protein
VQTVLAVAGGGAIAIGQTNPGTSGNAAKPSKDAKVMHSVDPKGKPFSSIDVLYKGKPGEFQRRFFDFRGKASLDIDFTGHAPGSGHANPHFHFWDPITGRQ